MFDETVAESTGHICFQIQDAETSNGLRHPCGDFQRQVERFMKRRDAGASPGARWGWVKTLSPCSSHQNSWVKMDVHPLNGMYRY